MKIGNIVSESELVNHNKLDYVNYYDSLSYDELNQSLPTLYVGWVFMKKINPNNEIIQNANILNKRIISNQLYWEFSFDENKKSHINGIDFFTKGLPLLYFKPKYSYIDLDPVFFSLKDINDVMDVLPKYIDKCYQFKDEMLYLLVDNKITSLNLQIYKFFKFNINELLETIKNKTTTIILDNGSNYNQYLKSFPNFENLKRYMVTIL